MNKELEQLAREVAAIAKEKFNSSGTLYPYFYGIRDDGTVFIFDPEKEGILKGELDGLLKQALSYTVEILFATHAVKRYVYVSEAWALTTGPYPTDAEIEEINKVFESGDGLSNHPKRIEVLVYEAEDIDGNRISGFQSIIHPAGKKAYLDDDLKLEDATEWKSVGRFTHLLDFRKYYDTQ